MGKKRLRSSSAVRCSVTYPYPLRTRSDQTRSPPKWQYTARPEAAAQGVAWCDAVNRGPTYANSRVFFTTLDAQAVAVDAQTGNEV